MNRFSAIAVTLLFLGGCNKPDASQSGAAPAGQRKDGRSGTKDIIYTMTQYDKIEAAQKTKERIRKVADSHNEDLDEVTKDQP